MFYIIICLLALAASTLFISGTAVQLHLICSNLASQRIQGIMPVASMLHLFINDHHYQIPFTDDYINSGHAMIGLFKQTDAFEYLTKVKHWTEVNGFAPVVARLGGKKNAKKATLEQVNLFQSPDFKTQFAHLIFNNGHFLVNQTAGKILETESNQLTERYAILSNGNHQEYILCSNSINQVVFVPGPVVADGHHGPQLTILPNINSVLPNGSFFGNVFRSRVHFSTNIMAGARPLVTDPSFTFGFIYQKTVHVWDFTTRQVYLFAHPPVGYLSTLTEGTELRTERMSTYFTCSRDAWQIKINQSDAPSTSSAEQYDDGNDSGTTATTSAINWLVIGIGFLMALLLGLIIAVFILYYFRCCSSSQYSSHVGNKFRVRRHRRRPRRLTRNMIKTPRAKSVANMAAASSSIAPPSSGFDSTHIFNCRAPSSSMATEKSEQVSLFVAKLPFFADTNKTTRKNDTEPIKPQKKAPYSTMLTTDPEQREKVQDESQVKNSSQTSRPEANKTQKTAIQTLSVEMRNAVTNPPKPTDRGSPATSQMNSRGP